ncbi:MAG: CotH kinase family protein, partial [Flavobacteriaceae bacterium]|nr:CotH kinase family protein [Flavobacteriaceae bacterium]
PIVKITTTDSIVNEPKIIAHWNYTDSIANFKNTIGIELRGNSALKYPKKSYDIEIRNDSLPKVSIDIQLSELRKDDDWILNSLFNEPLKLRSYFSTKLWLDVHKPSYLDQNPKAKSSNDLVFVEVFLNESYKGLYLLSEPVDRKQLQLKKMKADTVYGELFKANRAAAATTFKNAPTFNNAFPTWGGFQMKYPYENYEAHWGNIYQFVSLISTEEDEKFIAQIEQHLDIENAVDYFLFTNLLRATDNLGKNYFLARYTQDTPYFFVPWDLDGILGCIQDAKRIETTNDIMSNSLFDRLLSANPSNYRGKLKVRWEQLRTNDYSNEALIKRLEDTYTFLEDHNLYERDNLVWPRASKPETDLIYLKSWMEKRLQFLDRFFAGFE